MLTVFRISEGVVVTDFLENGATVNSERYIDTPVRRKEAEIDDVLLQQDNARPHTSAATTDVIARLGLTVLLHPAYSPDLAPSNFHLFPKLKEDLRGQNSALIKKLKLLYVSGFGRKKKFFLRRGFKNLLNAGKNVLELQEILWRSDYALL
jgi:histone-lysine N-methyltransferase SETMAR